MRYKVDGESKEINLNFDKITIKEFIEKTGENRESVIVKINGKIVTEFDSISNGDKVELIKISSGG